MKGLTELGLSCVIAAFLLFYLLSAKESKEYVGRLCSDKCAIFVITDKLITQNDSTYHVNKIEKGVIDKYYTDNGVYKIYTDGNVLRRVIHFNENKIQSWE